MPRRSEPPFSPVFCPLWEKSISSGRPTRTSIPMAAARVSTTAIVCGWQSAATKKTERPERWFAAAQRCIASAAAVPSSKSEALAIGRPVRSSIRVWKLSSASRRPCEISDW